ncbi:hypothetical protein, unlikely [Trypanosoma brucei brucei TREU927]|uniref:Uncharacterized protein n=1 Tax=Trypanosoma brucei brucei (strain 927/4 GUTat10.1) TaxID=185431 RepID=Q387Q2_TRYB2|nr:hypothetical protein, unlikely [Trypanosoma brucei brucei TREU927]EAN78970.1 hypothetical protein, unlikely [Trypanosoma brucei brucei TREU927]
MPGKGEGQRVFPHPRILVPVLDSSLVVAGHPQRHRSFPKRAVVLSLLFA